MNDKLSRASSPESGVTSLNGQASPTWHSEAGFAEPSRLERVDDTLRADEALRKMRNGIGLLWCGDFHNARQLLQALGRRLDRKKKPGRDGRTLSLKERFHQYRLQQSQRARLLGLLLIRIEPDNTIALRRAPAWQAALAQAYGQAHAPMLVSLRELLGVVGAFEWRRKGVAIAGCDWRIHPHYGVFSPSRSEYLTLIRQAPLPDGCQRAFDIGTGTGVLSILLADKGVAHIIATDSSPRAVACAQENVERLGLQSQITIEQKDFFPEGKADLLVCNPPWLPGKVSSSLDAAVYDPEEQMLNGFLREASQHLAPGGQIWLIMSDLAQLLGLREADAIHQRFAASGLRVVADYRAKPVHGRAYDSSDPLHEARAQETTHLWCLVPTDTEN